MEQQRECTSLGMWSFLATEVMMFGGLAAPEHRLSVFTPHHVHLFELLLPHAEIARLGVDQALDRDRARADVDRRREDEGGEAEAERGHAQAAHVAGHP